MFVLFYSLCISVVLKVGGGSSFGSTRRYYDNFNIYICPTVGTYMCVCVCFVDTVFSPELSGLCACAPYFAPTSQI